MVLPPIEKDISMQIRRFVKPLAASLLAAGLFGLAAAPVSSTVAADTGWGRKAVTSTVLADTGWGKKAVTDDTGWGRI
jgi:hypothetical protein